MPPTKSPYPTEFRREAIELVRISGSELVTDALQMALACRKPEAGLIHHSDQGSQYVSLAFGQKALDWRELQSAVFDCIEAFYNRERRHSTLGYLLSLPERVRDDLNPSTNEEENSSPDLSSEAGAPSVP